MNVSNIANLASQQTASSTSLQQSVAVTASQLDNARAEGEQAVKLIDSAAVAQTTGKGRHVDVSA